MQLLFKIFQADQSDANMQQADLFRNSLRLPIRNKLRFVP
jgi:hypothetical protein